MVVPLGSGSTERAAFAIRQQLSTCGGGSLKRPNQLSWIGRRDRDLERSTHRHKNGQRHTREREA